MKGIPSLALALFLVMAGCTRQASVPQSVEVYFSPKGGATEAVVNALDQATNSVLVQAYSFTSAPIAKALVNAHQRGVKVRVILDESQRTERYTEADFLRNYGIPPLIDTRHAIAHNKIMIIDGYLVITGSFNFTKSAEERNAENLLLIHDPVLAQRYIENWHAHAEHAEPFERPYQPEEQSGPRQRTETKNSPARTGRSSEESP